MPVRERFAAIGRPLTVIVVVATILGLTGGVATANEFVVRCFYDHSLADDPIVFPGQPGASHAHDFFGNTSTDAGSTYDSMVNNSNAPATSCIVATDTAAYWAPQALLGGAPLPYTHDSNGDVRAYYLNEPKSGAVAHFPRDLQMIAGSSRATAPLPVSQVMWFCGANPAYSTPYATHPYNCDPYRKSVTSGGNGFCGPNGCPFVTGVVVRLQFARCWDGSSAALGHMTYTARQTCLSMSGHQWLPLVSVRFHLGMLNPCYNGAVHCTATDAPDSNIALSFSSGAYYSVHADFWNTWQQQAVDDFVDNCLQPGTLSCGFLPRQQPIRRPLRLTAAGN